MSRIRIKNFGPIKEGYLEDDGWMDIKKVTLFIGNQGSGKSTVAKVISTLTWLEKALERGDISEPKSIDDFQAHFEYQGLKGYFKDYLKTNTVIEYDGDSYSFGYNNTNSEKGLPFPGIKKKQSRNYILPKIMYVPAERNFVSVIEQATSVKGLPGPLFDFIAEFKKSQREFEGKEIHLPINGVSYKYDVSTDTSLIIGNDYVINLLLASSGFQTLVPLFLVSLGLSRIIKNGSEIGPGNISVEQSIRMNKEIGAIMFDSKLNDEQKLEKVEIVKAKFQNKAFINIVEEPEQNLFPSSQQHILNSLLEFNNRNEGNRLVITTHSPYIINFLSIAIQAAHILDRITSKSDSGDLLAKLNEVIPVPSIVNSNDLAIYQLDEKTGTIRKLPDFEGIPSDKNFLNQSLAQGNQLFDSLLAIEEEL